MPCKKSLMVLMNSAVKRYERIDGWVIGALRQSFTTRLIYEIWTDSIISQSLVTADLLKSDWFIR